MKYPQKYGRQDNCLYTVLLVVLVIVLLLLFEVVVAVTAAVVVVVALYSLTPVLSCGFPLKNENQKISILQDASKYSSRFNQYCFLDVLNFSSDLQFLQSFSKTLETTKARYKY